MLMSINSIAQWTYPRPNKIKNDIIITYDVVYENTLTEKQKKHPYYKKEIIVIFREGKILEKNISNSLEYQEFSLLDYVNEKAYSCRVRGSSKLAIVSDFRNPKKKTTLIEGMKETILGFPCDVYITKIRGKSRKIYTTQKFGFRYIKHFNTEGFLLKYVSNNKYLGISTVTAKKITYTTLPDEIYSLKGFSIKTPEKYKENITERKERSLKNKEKNIERLGELAPKFSVRSIQGKKLKKSSLEGKIIVLNFWYTTCPPCKKEIPQLNSLKEKFKDKNVEFIAVALDQEYKIDKFLKKNPFKYDIVEDGRWIAEKFDIKFYPTNIIIDKQGKYQFVKTGYKKDIAKAMAYKIDKLLQQ